MATSFALEAGSFVRPSIHKVLGPRGRLSYATPLKHLRPPLSCSGVFVRGCSVVLYEDSKGLPPGGGCFLLFASLACCEL
jgi:hypothetical protein